MIYGVSYEQVAAAAETIRARGERPSVRSVRDILGTGSLTTIQRFLNAWIAKQPVQKPEPIDELPGELVRAITAEFARRESTKTAELRKQLSESQETQAKQTSALETKEAQLFDVVKERDVLQGRLQQTERQVADLETQLDMQRRQTLDLTARVAALDAQLALAAKQQEAAVASASARLQNKILELERTVDSMRAENTEAKKVLSEFERLRKVERDYDKLLHDTGLFKSSGV